FVQRIATAKLHNNGAKVRITVQGTPSGNAVINNVFFSSAASLGNPYDSLPAGNPGGLAQVASVMVLADDQPKTLDFVDYSLDQTQDLIIAFDLTVTANQGNLRYDPSPGVTFHFKSGVQEVGTAARSPGYTLLPDPRQYLVKQIEVL